MPDYFDIDSIIERIRCSKQTDADIFRDSFGG